MSKVSYIDIDKTRYYFNGTYGAWCKTYENSVKVGDVRFIGNIFLYAYKVYPAISYFGKKEIWWCGAKPTEMTGIREWWDNVKYD